MQDIANKAGVSKGTVSYVLNGKQEKARINQETCAKVIAIAEKMGYRRNAVAQSMKTGKTNMVAFIGGIGDEYVMKIIKGINTELAAKDYLLKMMSIEWGGKDISKVARQCVEQMVSGVICRALSEEHLEMIKQEFQPHNIPVVLVDNSFSHDWCPRVVSDDFTGEIMAVKHLYELGHRRIGHLTTDETKGFTVLRKSGFEQGMKECGLECGKDNFAYIKNLIEVSEDDHKSFQFLLNTFKPTAIVCASDPIAMKFMQWSYRCKLQIPEDISVVGYANLDLTRYASPGLTTIKQPFKEMGVHAARKIIDVITHGKNGEDEYLPVKLICRDSTRKI